MNVVFPVVWRATIIYLYQIPFCPKCGLKWKNKARKVHDIIKYGRINTSFGFCPETLLDSPQIEMVIPSLEFPHCQHEQTEAQLLLYRTCLTFQNAALNSAHLVVLPGARMAECWED